MQHTMDYLQLKKDSLFIIELSKSNGLTKFISTDEMKPTPTIKGLTRLHN